MNTKLLVPTAALATIVAGALLTNTRTVKAEDDFDLMRSKLGLQMSPVPVDQSKNAYIVGLGSYFVNAQGGCNDCHTCPSFTPGHNPYPPPLGVNGDGQVNSLNYMAGGTPFALPPPFNTVKSPNLTPDSNGKPGGMTAAQFINAIKTGHDPDDPSETLVVMPWPVYRNMNDRDLTAIYTYLTAIPHAEPGVCSVAGQ